MKNLVKKVGLLSALVALAAQAHATCSGTPFACAVDFTSASTDVGTVGVAVITFGLLIVGFAIVWRLMHTAKRA